MITTRTMATITDLLAMVLLMSTSQINMIIRQKLTIKTFIHLTLTTTITKFFENNLKKVK